MPRIELESSQQAEIVIEAVGGTLHLKGWDLDQIRLDFLHADDNYVQEGNQLKVNTASDCVVRVPMESELTIKQVGGNAHLTDISGPIALEQASGSVYLKRVGSAKIRQVSGNLNARELGEDLTVETVSGNAELRDVRGNLAVKKVHGNLNLRDAGGNATANVMGNAHLRLSPPAKSLQQIDCKGNAYCRLEAQANVEVRLRSKAGTILVHNDEGVQNLEAKEETLIFGKGESKLEISAGGHIDFRSRQDEDDINIDIDLDFIDDLGGVAEEIGEQISAQVESQLEALGSQLEALSERLQNSGDRAVQRAQRNVQAAQRRFERKLQARGHGRGKRIHAGVIAAGGAPHAASEPVTEEERLKVLQMVSEKKISVDEAEMLLGILEGREAPRKRETDEKDE